MALAQLREAQAKPLHGAGAEILHQHVRLPDQLGQHLAPDVGLDVDGKRTLAAVGRDEQGGKISRLVDGLAAAPGDVAAERLDLEHIGALVRQEHGGQRPGHHARQINDLHAAEWSRHRRSPEAVS